MREMLSLLPCEALNTMQGFALALQTIPTDIPQTCLSLHITFQPH